MRTHHGAPATALAVLTPLLFATLAGCAGGGASPQSSDDLDAEGAILRGVVLDTELRPIPNALIKAGGFDPALTGEDGRFELAGLPPGDIRVTVYALGYHSASRSATLIHGDAVFLQFTIERLPIEEPYLELLIYRGYDICSASVLYSAGYIAPCLLGARSAVFWVEVRDAWAYGVFEMEWHSAESMLFASTHRPNVCNTGEPCWGIEVGRSPIRMDAKPDDLEIAKRHALQDDKAKLYPVGAFTMVLDSVYAGFGREELNQTAGAQCASLNPSLGLARRFGCPLGVGYSLGVSFHYYHTIFYVQVPSQPELYSGRPDA